MVEVATKANLANGKILLGFRKQNKMSQSELGKIINRDSRDISKYETGMRPIPQDAVDFLNAQYKLKLKATNKVVKGYSLVSKPVEKVSKKVTKTKVVEAVKSKASSKKSKTIVSEAPKTTKSSTKSFGSRLAALRQSLNLTQTAFAKKFSFEPTKVSRLESDKSNSLTISSIKALNKSGYLTTLLK